MKAVVLNAYGDLDVLTITEVADPVPGPEEVLVEGLDGSAAGSDDVGGVEGGE